MPDQNADPELKAIEQVMQALNSLEQAARERVVNYVFQRLGLAVPGSRTPLTIESPTVPVMLTPAATQSIPAADVSVRDIRSFKMAKNPKSDNEMAALVAYYLKYLAPSDERKDTIATSDIEKYFVQANYPLPNKPQYTLANAKNAGYFDSAERGFFKLNPVGNNLVAHGLGKGGVEPTSRRSGTAKRQNTKDKCVVK